MEKFALGLCAAALVFSTVAPASAAVLVDGFPTGPLLQPNWTNRSAGQNFLVKFTLASAANITGFDILLGRGFSALGDSLRVKIRADVAGNPDAVNLFSFVDQIDTLSSFAANVDQLGTSFGSIALSAGDYWFGVSGEGNTKVWASYNNNGLGFTQIASQRQLFADQVLGTPRINELAFRVNGDFVNGAVPEPAAWALMIAGFGLVGAAMRRRKTSVRVTYA